MDVNSRKIETVGKGATNTDPNLTYSNIRGIEMAKESLPENNQSKQTCITPHCRDKVFRSRRCKVHFSLRVGSAIYRDSSGIPIKRLSHTGRNAERNAEIIKFYQAGKTLRDCGAMFGISGQAVRLILIHNGIPKVSRRKPTPPKLTQKEKFWRRVFVKGPDDCWIHSAKPDPAGYCRARYDGRTDYAHRISFEIHNGYRPELHVLHSCDNPPCCNPRHLREGTMADNMKDRDERGASGLAERL